MPVKKVANAEQTEKERPPQWQADTERYLLQIDRQTKRSFKTPDCASHGTGSQSPVSNSAGLDL
jgi:hypothetical protein